MPMIPFIGSSYEHRSKDVSSQRTLNMYPEIIDNQEAKSNYVLIKIAGLSLYQDLSDIVSGVTRGWTTVGYKASAVDPVTQRRFGVWEDKLIEITSETTREVRGTLPSLVGEVSMTSIVNYLVLADGNSIYVYDLENDVFSSPTTPFEQPIKVITLNSRIVVINSDPTIDEVRNFNKFYWSAINDPTSWDAIDWNSAQSNSDPLISIEKRQGEMWLFGPQSYEVWRITENADAPYARAGGSFTEIGCGALNSTSQIGENIFWLGSSRAGQNQIFVSNGYNAQRISTHAIEYQISKNKNLTTDAHAMTFQEGGHTFYALNFPTEQRTWCYDTTTGQWSERGTRNPLNNDTGVWSPKYAIFDGKQIVFASGLGPYLLKSDDSVYDEWSPTGNIPIQIERRTPIYWSDLRLMFHDEFQIDIQTGVGLQNGQGSDPKMIIDWSDDGGYTWSNQLRVPFGKIGKYEERLRVRRLGRSRKRVYRVICADPVEVNMIGGRIIARTGSRP